MNELQEIKTESRKEMGELKAKFRTEIQETGSILGSKLFQMQAQTPTFPTGLHTKIESVQQLITSLLLKQEKSDFQLEKLDTKLDNFNSMMSSIVLQQGNNVNPSKNILQQLSSSKYMTPPSSTSTIVGLDSKVVPN